METLITVIEWIGSLLGFAGALLLARRPELGVSAYLTMLAASVLLTLFGLLGARYGIATGNACFILTNLVGLQRRLRDTRSGVRVFGLLSTKP